MENRKETEKRVFNPGDILRHTDLSGERNPLPKLPEGFKWRGYEKDKGTGKFIKYMVVDLNAPPPTIDDLPPVGVEGPLYTTREEALRENPPAQPTLPTIEPTKHKGEDETL